MVAEADPAKVHKLAVCGRGARRGRGHGRGCGRSNGAGHGDAEHQTPSEGAAADPSAGTSAPRQHPAKPKSVALMKTDSAGTYQFSETLHQKPKLETLLRQAPVCCWIL